MIKTTLVRLFSVELTIAKLIRHVPKHIILDTPTEDRLSRQLLRELEGVRSRIVGRIALASKEFLLRIIKFYRVGCFIL